MNVLDFQKRKRTAAKISMVTCYDHWSAKIINDTAIDVVLVGDSCAMVMHGHADTIPADLPMLAAHVRAVRLGAPDKFIVADLPFLSFRGSLDESLKGVRHLLQAGAQAVKLEGARGNESLIRHLVESGVPVMGHLGLTPQFIHTFGGFRVQGRSSEQQAMITEDARRLEEWGCFALVLEGIPAALGQTITAASGIPTIGIGAGPDCDGQVLVLHDLLGLQPDFKPKFVRHYLNGADLVRQALNAYHADVTHGRFPDIQEVYE